MPKTFLIGCYGDIVYNIQRNLSLCIYSERGSCTSLGYGLGSSRPTMLGWPILTRPLKALSIYLYVHMVRITFPSNSSCEQVNRQIWCMLYLFSYTLLESLMGQVSFLKKCSFSLLLYSNPQLLHSHKQ